MNNQFFDNMNENTRKMYEPWSRFNQAMLKNAEKMTDFSLETMRHYSEMGLEQLRNVSAVDSPEAASNFSQKQTELMNELGQKMLADAQRLTELGNEIRNEVMTAMNEVYSNNATNVKSAMEQATQNASKTAESFNRKVSENMSKAASQMNEAVRQTSQNMSKATETMTTATSNAMNNTAKTASDAVSEATTKPATARNTSNKS